MRLAAIALAGLLALLTAHYAGAPLPWPAAAEWLYQVIEAGAAAICLVRGVRGPDRGAWLCMGLAIASFCAGDVYFHLAFDGGDIAFPSPADAGYLGFYPAAYAALVLLVRSRLTIVPPGQWLDGVVGALAIGAAGAAVLLNPLVAGTGGDVATVATNLAYPLGDLLLLGLLTGAVLLTRGREPRWLLIAAGFAIFAITDSAYLYGTATGGYADGTVLDSGWPAAMVLLAVAATLRQPVRRIVPHEGLGTLVLPAISGLVTLAITVRDHYDRVNAPALWLASLALLAVLVRTAVTFHENWRMIRRSRREAVTDPLTGLGNRRRLLRDLDEATAGRGVLALFDLNGFKAYNDTYGHPAGDALLGRLGARLAGAVPTGRAYRMGGDEFCVLVPLGAGEESAAVVARANAALDLKADSLSVSASHGAVIVPDDAATAASALQLADQRMYDEKNATRPDGKARIAAVLLRALHARRPDLGDHDAGVARLAEGVAHRLGLAADELAHVRMAAALHDIGKLAIPDAILDKPGPLDDAEWELMRRHTAIGAGILAADPSLLPVAAMVRGSHERWDGGGYPDGLAGIDIPLGARIICVCDAWDAMRTDRPYRAALPVAGAVAELRRCAGDQFDPAAVEAFIAERDDATVAAYLGAAA